ncbi:sperm flagellar protein 1-like [Teleopsis dalmanni]|uniref:sperm flagellar protein 1-like n=1 Tax=Teleopsis dalmanni TaxID=139649 RepID=UPI0018CF0494|nr:sperm flagellar protein 1-like [Teleopsis dalmanni]
MNQLNVETNLKKTKFRHRHLSEIERKLMVDWLQKHEIVTRKLSRDFSDAVLMAKLLKKITPKWIDIHNYPSRNSFKLKLINWETMNSKVFTKLQIKLSKLFMEKIAKAEPGSIDILLYEIMLMDKSNPVNEQKAILEEKARRENGDILVVTVGKKIGKSIMQVPQKMILYSIYEKTIDELNVNKTNLEAAYEKIARFEYLLGRIEHLTGQIFKLANST